MYPEEVNDVERTLDESTIFFKNESVAKENNFPGSKCEEYNVPIGCQMKYKQYI